MAGPRMPHPSSEDALWSTPLPLTVLSIGLWEDDVGTDRIRCDATMARMFGLPEDETITGIPWACLASRFHPEDVGTGSDRHRRVREEGGLFVWEHRVVQAPGVIRWVLARGYFERGADGLMHGRGIVIDMTDSRTDGYVEGPARLLTAEAPGSVEELMTDRVLELWELTASLGADAEGRVRPLLKLLLQELGRLIAASLAVEKPSPQIPVRPHDPKMH